MTFWAKKFIYFVNQAVERMPEEDRMIGGECVAVEIDETVISKRRKYNRGSITPEIWLFGGKERDSNKWFAEIIQARTRNNLVDAIKRFIRPGSIVISDQWRGYWSSRFNLELLPGQNYLHLTVNHQLYYVDPDTGASTNLIEGHWGNLKTDMRKKRGMQLEAKKDFLNFKLWASYQNTENTSLLNILFSYFENFLNE